MAFLEENLKQSKDKECYEEKSVADGNIKSIISSRTNAARRKYGSYTPTVLHKSHLCSSQSLDYYHSGATQVLLRRQFPNIGGFKNTVVQDTDSVRPFTEKENLQIIHVKLEELTTG